MRWMPALSLLAGLAIASSATAFCGFFVAKADGTLVNRTSQVVLARDGDHTVITMANDYQGPASEFAMIVPVPAVLQPGDVRVIDPALLDHLGRYTAPRVAAYQDPDPCPPSRFEIIIQQKLGKRLVTEAAAPPPEPDDLGVTVEARYDVEEYDVLVLSAKESTGLVTWLNREGYTIPAGAEPVLNSYLRDGLRFFVAKVDLDALDASATPTMLRPLQVRYDSPRFTLPIRLGTVNAVTEQDLVLHTLTRRGRVEASNYRTVPMATDVTVPTFVERSFGEVYGAVFEHTIARSGREVVVTEYAWPLSVMCDPCSADPLTRTQLGLLGATWVGDGKQSQAAFVTRLHVRYDRDTFVEDLRLVETADTTPVQARFVVQQPWAGDTSCKAGAAYLEDVAARRQGEQEQLIELTGWPAELVSERMDPLPVWR